MENVAVFGDVRVHAIQWEVKRNVLAQPKRTRGLIGEKSQVTQQAFFGGATLLGKAVRLALKTVSEDTGLVKRVEPPSDATKTEIDTYWNLEPRVVEGCETMRLVNPQGLAEVSPPFSEDVIQSKLEESFVPSFLTDETSDGTPNFDLVFVDDLGFWMNQIEIAAWSRQGRGSLRKYAKILDDFFVTLLSQAKRTDSATGNYARLSPTIVVSVTGHLPDLEAARKKGTFWGRLYDSPELSGRTVVILDAHDLRNHSVGISTALSWERTVQDTVAELRRHPTLKMYSRFGNVIIRYGVTGALHCRFDRDGEMHFTLHFTPDQEDSAWQLPKDGHVLGYNDVIAGTLAQHIYRICEARDKKHLLSDLSDAVGAAVHESIERCQYLCAHGYGKNFGGRFSDDGIAPLPVRMFELGTLFDEERTGEWKKLMRRPPLVSQVVVPRFYSRTWAILSQTAQYEVGELAEQIVKYGMQAALNQPPWRVDRFCETLHHWILKKVNSRIRNDRFSRSDAKLKQEIREIFEDAIQGLVSSSELVFGRRPLEIRNRVVSRLNDGILNSTYSDADGGSAAYVKLSIHDCIREYFLSECNKLKRTEAVDKCYRKLKSTKNNLANATRREQRLRNQLHLKAKDDLRKARERYYESELQCDEWREKLRHIVTDQLAKAIRDSVGIEKMLKAWPGAMARFGETPKDKSKDRRIFFLDRLEIEGVRTVRNLIYSHLQQIYASTNERPLSIAVFGPPGSGKSLAVKAIIGSIASDFRHEKRKPDFVTYNLSVYHSSDEIRSNFNEISDRIKECIPIVFFDEFDSKLGEQDLGWLKFFLTPMEDGKYENKLVKDAVFVFAGGTSENYSAFSLENRSRKDQEWIKFSQAKGPDFVRRLRGHLNVTGINRTDLDDELYLVRRALFLRFQLTINQDLENFEEARIDPDVLRALLQVPEYRHGGGSLRMVLQSCTGLEGDVIKSTLPTLDQLNMHVDGKAFMDMVNGVSKPSGTRTMIESY